MSASGLIVKQRHGVSEVIGAGCKRRGTSATLGDVSLGVARSGLTPPLIELELLHASN